MTGTNIAYQKYGAWRHGVAGIRKTIMIHQLAYLDPGTGSFLLQMLAGGLFGGMFMLKRFFRQAKNAIITPKAQPQRDSH